MKDNNNKFINLCHRVHIFRDVPVNIWCSAVHHPYNNNNTATVGERRGVYRVLVGKPEGKRPLGIPRRRWEDNIKKVGCGGMDWI